MVQRIGPNTQLNIYPEVTPGSDTGITTGFKLAISKLDSFGVKQPTQEAAPALGARRAPDRRLGMRDASGTGSYFIDNKFRTHARVLKLLFGASGYSRLGSLHKNIFAGQPGYFQPEKASNDGTAVFQRQRANIFSDLSGQLAESGPAECAFTLMGNGDTVRSYSSALTTVVDDGFNEQNYFCGQMTRAGVVETNLGAFNYKFDNTGKVPPKFFSPQGIKGLPFAGQPRTSGKMGIYFIDQSFYEAALAGSPFFLELLFSDLDPTVGANAWWRLRLPGVVLDPDNSGTAGGEDLLMVNQNWYATIDQVNGNLPAEIIGSVLGTYDSVSNTYQYTVPSPASIGFKINGGSTLSGTISPGAQSAAAIATQVNAFSGFAAVAIADQFCGRLRIKSLLKGLAKTVQCDTTVTNSIHALLGFTNTSVPGSDPIDVVSECFNDIASDL